RSLDVTDLHAAHDRRPHRPWLRAFPRGRAGRGRIVDARLCGSRRQGPGPARIPAWCRLGRGLVLGDSSRAPDADPIRASLSLLPPADFGRHPGRDRHSGRRATLLPVARLTDRLAYPRPGGGALCDADGVLLASLALARPKLR